MLVEAGQFLTPLLSPSVQIYWFGAAVSTERHEDARCFACRSAGPGDKESAP